MKTEKYTRAELIAYILFNHLNILHCDNNNNNNSTLISVIDGGMNDGERDESVKGQR